MASPAQLNKESPISMAAASSPPLFSPHSDKRFWSTLRSRVETILDARNGEMMPPSTVAEPASGRGSNPAKRLKQDSLLLLRGFDSIASSLSQLTGDLDNALQGARDLSKPPSFTEILQSVSNGDKPDGKVEKEEEHEEQKIGVKRKQPQYSSDDNEEEENKHSEVDGKLKKAKNLAASMAAKAAWLSRELKSMKSDMCFVQERCALLEEENQRLRDGFVKGVRPEEDDLVRLQLEALLTEKSRLANENANLTRENQCLRQLVEYHQFAAQDVSPSYDEVMEGMCLDFSSPLASRKEGEEEEEYEDNQSAIAEATVRVSPSQ